jgi:hypothetical protein
LASFPDHLKIGQLDVLPGVLATSRHQSTALNHDIYEYIALGFNAWNRALVF